MKNHASLRCLWLAFVTYAYAPAIILITLVIFGYEPIFGTGHDTEMVLWYLACIAPGIALVLANAVSWLLVEALRKPSIILFIAWFPYILLSGVLYITLYRRALYAD